MARKSIRKAQVQELVKEAEKKAAEKLEKVVAKEPPAPHLSEEEKEKGAEESSMEPETPVPTSKRRGRAPISPEGALVRVLTFLPRSLVEKIQETGRPMSRFIREILEEKLGG